MLSFCKQLLSEFTVGPGAVRVAAATFSRGVKEQWGFGQYTSQGQVGERAVGVWAVYFTGSGRWRNSWGLGSTLHSDRCVKEQWGLALIAYIMDMDITKV